MSTRVLSRTWRVAGGVAAGLLLVGTLAACGGGSSGAGVGASGAGVGASGAGAGQSGAGAAGAGVSGGATVQVSQDDLDGLQAATSDADRTAAQAEHDLASDD